MWCLVPGEDSSTGNVTGGRKLARYVLVNSERVVAGAISCVRSLDGAGGCSLERTRDDGSFYRRYSLRLDRHQRR